MRGNNEKNGTENLPPFLDFELTDLRVFMTHKKKDLPKDLMAYDLVVFGHSGAMGAGLSILEHRSVDGYRNYFRSYGGIIQLSMEEGGKIFRVDERVFI